MQALLAISAAESHLGAVRRINEDACLELADQGLWVVADGMGGHQAGDVASQSIVAALADIGGYQSMGEFVTDVERRLLAVDARLRQASGGDEDAMMGSTVVALLAWHRLVAFVWAGDSRAYRLRAGRLRQLTRDHSEVEELIARGELTREAAEAHPSANVITRAIGALDGTETLEVGMSDLRPGDRYLLCSDGLSNYIEDTDLSEVLTNQLYSEAPRVLVDMANSRGGDDNITVVLTQAFFDTLWAAPQPHYGYQQAY